MAAYTASPARAPERGRHDKEGRRLALIEAAVEVFAERGYDAATTREVAVRAGCAEGLIHRYFGGKQGLLLAAIEEKHEALAAGLSAAVAAAGTVAEKITGLITGPMEEMWDHRAFLRVAIARSIVDPEVGQTIGGFIARHRVEFMAERLGAHQRAGALRGDIDIHALAEAISGLSFSLGFMAQVVFGEEREGVRKLALEAARIICHGALAPGAATEMEGGIA